MKVNVINYKGEKVKEISLPKEVFEIPWNGDLVHQIVRSQMANQRVAIAHVKDRGEVRGGGKKPWRQKGTGRARHGSRRSPLWVGGGVTFGPTKEKVFKQKINKKMGRKAVLAVLSKKAKEHEMVVLDDLKLSYPKTKEMALLLKQLSLPRINALIVIPKYDATIVRASRNIPHINVAEAGNISVLDLLTHKFIIFPESSIEVFEKVFAKK